MKISQVLILFGILTLISCNENNTRKSIQTASLTSKTEINYDSINKIALEVIREEPKVKKATIDDNILYAHLEDEKQKRNGYAEYLCQVLKQNQSNIKHVRIIMYGSLFLEWKDSPHGVIMGEAICK